MRRHRKGRRIRYGKLLVFLFFVFIILALMITAVVQGISYIRNTFSASEESKPSYYLLVGVDNQRSAEADSIVVASINRKQKELALISIPGNTKISKDEKTNTLLKSTFAEGNIEETQSAVENLLHIRINNYAVFDYESFSNLFSQVGDISLYVEKMMSHDDETGNSDIWLHQGYQALNAQSALQYVRYIDSRDGEIGRIQRGERLIKTMIQHLQNNLSIFNWGLAKYYWKAADTNISSSDAASLAYDLKDFPIENIHFIILPGEQQKIDKVDTWIANPVEIQKVVGLTLGQSEN